MEIKRNIIVFILLSLFSVMGMQAQTRYERKDFTFKTTKVKDANGEISHVKLGTYACGKLVKEYSFELTAPVSEDMAETIGHISEEDINFDGYPDLDIYLGYFGGFANNTCHEAMLWDQKQHRFVEAEDYNGIGEPMIDSEKKYITTVLSDGPDKRVTTYYRWNGNKLQEYLTNTWAIEDDDYVNFDGVLNLPCYRFDAKLDGRIPVNIVFQKTADDDIVAGYIYYPRAKNPAPIMIVGSVTPYGDKLNFNLNEYQSDGIVSGIIHLEMSVNADYFSPKEGSWTNPKTRKEMKLTDIQYSHEAPKWFMQSLLKPEDPGNIGREYSFQEWNLGAQDLMGGHITFRAAGKNKVHFECGNVRHNIAEGRSDGDRPAVLNGNIFEYREVNECHYGFRATFFPRFVVLSTITDYKSLDCFGMGAAFDGVYIKVKQ